MNNQTFNIFASDQYSDLLFSVPLNEIQVKGVRKGAGRGAAGGLHRREGPAIGEEADAVHDEHVHVGRGAEHK